MANEKKISQNRPRSAANDILLTVLLAFSIILGVALYVPGARVGIIGTGLNLFLRGLLGPVALMLPALICVFSILFLVKRYPLPKLDMILHGSMLLIALSALIHVVTVPVDDMHSLSAQWALQASPPRTDATAGDTLALLWESGANPQQSGFMAGRHPGGLLGGMMALAFISLVGKFGATIVLLAALVIEAVLLFNFSLSLVFDRTGSLLKDAGSRLREVGFVAAEHVGRGTHTLSKPVASKERSTADAPISRSSRTKQIQPTLDHDLGGGSQATLRASRDLPEQAHEPSDSLSVGRGTAQRLLTYGTVGDHEDEVQVPDFYGHDPLLDGSSKREAAGKPASPLSQVPYQATEQNWGDALDEAVLAEVRITEEQETREKPQVVSYTQKQTAKRVVPAKPISQGDQVELPDAFEQDDTEKRPYRLPPLELLQPRGTAHGMDHERATLLGDKLEQTLLSFGVQAKVIHITTGPTITRFELAPGPGVKVSRIVNLTDDIALSLAAVGVRIEAPIPGKSAIGIEISNKETSIVGLRSILEEERGQPHRQKLMVALGRDIPGAPIFSDLAKMPHLLIAGATGSGKSICINVILMNILYRARPDEVKLLLVDPKVVELSIYNGIPHLLAPVVTDPKKAANTLNWAVAEMNRRYGLFAQFRVRDLPSYNQRAKDQGKEVLPLIVLVIDELSDLMVTAAREVEESIARLTAMARAAGIHLIIATQRPSVDVITGVIKANMPSRIAFAVTSQVDSRTILDQGGAEKLLGKGDMLYYPQSASKPIRGQGAFVSEEEVEAVVSFVQAQEAGSDDKEVAEQIVSMTPSGKTESELEEDRAEDEDELLDEAVEIVLDAGYASVSILQRRLSVGYPRAARLIDSMEQAGYIGPFEGSKPRKVLINRLEWENRKSIAAGTETSDTEIFEAAAPDETDTSVVTESIATAGSDAVDDNKHSTTATSQEVEEPPFDFA